MALAQRREVDVVLVTELLTLGAQRPRPSAYAEGAGDLARVGHRDERLWPSTCRHLTAA